MKKNTKLYYDKKQIKYISISNIIDVYNGVNHSHNGNIKKYLKNIILLKNNLVEILSA